MEAIRDYFASNSNEYWLAVWQHLTLSGQALLLGYVSYKKPLMKQISTFLMQGLRVIPSLGILFILIPFVGIGQFPALIVLIFLGIPRFCSIPLSVFLKYLLILLKWDLV